jgi:hypothetical protein
MPPVCKNMMGSPKRSIPLHIRYKERVSRGVGIGSLLVFPSHKGITLTASANEMVSLVRTGRVYQIGFRRKTQVKEDINCTRTTFHTVWVVVLKPIDKSKPLSSLLGTSPNSLTGSRMTLNKAKVSRATVMNMAMIPRIPTIQVVSPLYRNDSGIVTGQKMRCWTHGRFSVQSALPNSTSFAHFHHSVSANNLIVDSHHCKHANLFKWSINWFCLVLGIAVFGAPGQ